MAAYGFPIKNFTESDCVAELFKRYKELTENRIKMSTHNEIKIFGNTPIRNFWEDEDEKWYFCILDIIEALTDSNDPSQYFKRLRKRDPELDTFVRGTNCTPHQFISTDGKRHSNHNCLLMMQKTKIALYKNFPKLGKFLP